MCLGDFCIRLFRMVMSCRDMRVRRGIGAGSSEPSFFLRFQALNVQLEEDPEQTQNTLERLYIYRSNVFLSNTVVSFTSLKGFLMSSPLGSDLLRVRLLNQ